MWIRKPQHASLDQVRITRDGGTAIIEPAASSIATSRFHIGPQIHEMSDQDILDKFNASIDIREKLRDCLDYVAIEIPPGRPQIEFVPGSGQWVPRGDVLRCRILDDEEGRISIFIDDQELSLEEFGRMLLTYNGWGMRITFVEEEDIYEEPDIEVREPHEGEK